MYVLFDRLLNECATHEIYNTLIFLEIEFLRKTKRPSFSSRVGAPLLIVSSRDLRR